MKFSKRCVSWIMVGAMLGALTWGSTAYAVPATTTASSSLKIGVLDMRVIMDKAPQIVKLNRQLEKDFKPREQKIVSAQKAWQTEADNFDKNAAVMNEVERAKAQAKISTDRANLQTMIASFQQDLNNAQNQGMEQFMKILMATVKKVAQTGQYDLILQAENTPYFNSSMDVTSTVLAQL